MQLLYNVYFLYNYLDSKLNPNIQSTLNKLVEEQLEQRIAINTLNEEIKHEISENRMILQNILMILTAGPLAKTDQTQGEKPKQRLKRKDTKNMWWDVSIPVLFNTVIYSIPA